MISVLVPTLPGRESWLTKLRESLEACGGDLELIVEHDGDNWGEASNLAAAKATGDYLFFCSDDVEVLPGWHDAACRVCDHDRLPAPLVFNTDLSWQSAGDYAPDFQPDGSPTAFSRFPFLSRGQWELLGPLLPVHFADPYLGAKAWEHGIPTIVTHGYRLVHHFAPEGRRDYDAEEAIRVAAEMEVERG